MNLIKDSKLQKNGNSLPCGDAEGSMNFSESKPEKPFSDNTGSPRGFVAPIKEAPAPFNSRRFTTNEEVAVPKNLQGYPKYIDD